MDKLLIQKCANCLMFGWPNEADQNKICAKCKILHYCTKECQIEHWHKLHKFHCKFLASNKERPETKHEPSRCRFCGPDISCRQRKRRARNQQKNSEDEGRLACAWRYTKSVGFMFCYENIHVLSPVMLGEVTGSFQSHSDHTVFTMERIISKMYSIGKYRVQGIEKLLENMMQELHCLRAHLLTLYCFMTEEAHHFHFSILESKTFKKIFIIRSLIRIKLTEKGLVVQDGKRRLWYTFEILFNLLNCAKRRNMTVPDSFSHRHYITITNKDYFHKWGEILKLIDSEKWTFGEIINLLVDDQYDDDGNLLSRCFGCDQMIRDILHFRCFDTSINRTPDVLIEGSVFFMSNVFSMGFSICKDCITSQIIVDMLNFDPDDIINEMNALTRSYRCDYCFQFKSSIHRCSRCLTKFYCGKYCQLEDWSIHKRVCVRNKRKKKDNQKLRKSNIRRLTMEFVIEEPF